MTRNRSLFTVLAVSLSLTALAAVMVPTFAQEPTTPPAPVKPQDPNAPPANPTPAQDPNAPVADKSQTLDAYDAAKKEPRLKNFIKAIDAAGLKDALKGKGPFTILAPTNNAFSNLPEGAWDDLQKPENKEKLVTILKYHVLPVKYTSADLAKLDDGATVGTSLPTSSIKVASKDRLKLNGVSVITPDIPTSNGVIHIVDAVLIPPTDPAKPATAAPPATP